MEGTQVAAAAVPASNTAPRAARGPGGREPTLDLVKEQGVLTAQTMKERRAARAWRDTWGFLARARDGLEEQALAQGFTREEYRAARQALSCEPPPLQYPVHVEPSPSSIPQTTNGMVGWRATCPLERYGRLIESPRDYPLRPPLPPGQAYDPYKQTFFFLGSVCGDPISHRLPPLRSDLPEEAQRRSVQLSVAPLSRETIERALRSRDIS